MEKIKNNKLNLVISTIILLLPVFIGIFIWDKLPESIPTHFNFRGEADDYSSKTVVVYGMPVFLMVIHIITVAIMIVGDKKKISDKIFGIMLYLIPFVSLVVICLCYIKALGEDVNVISVSLFVLGVVFLVIGNYLPKVKQNYALGVRLKSTMESRRNWEATNRFTGWMMCINGLGFIVLGILVTILEELIVEIIVIGMISLSVLLMVAYSHKYKTKHKDEDGYFDNK